MTKSTLIIHQDYLDDVIRSLHEAGLMEIQTITKEQTEDTDIQKLIMPPEASLCQEYEARLSALIKILKHSQKKTGGIKAVLHPQLPKIQEVEDLNLDELLSHVEGVIAPIEKKILTDDQKLQSLKTQQQQTTTYLTELLNYTPFDLVLSDNGRSDLLYIKIGKTQNLQRLQDAVRSIDELSLFSNQIGQGKKIQWSVIIVTHIDYHKELERLIADHFTDVDLPDINKTPKEAIHHLKEQKRTLEKQQKTIQTSLANNAKKHLQNLLAIREQIQLERIRKELPAKFARTQETIILQGWILAEKTDELKKTVDDVTNNNVIYEFQTPSPNPDHPPTYVKTPVWAQSFRTLLELFATPRYNEINPTVIMGIFFVLFFGFMLGDAGYGSVILALSLFAYIKFKRFSPMIRDWSFMGIWLGLITTIVGILTNGFFGDFIPRFIYGNPEQPLYQATLAGIQFPVEPLKDPLTILTIALILGLAHLNVGIILGIYQAYKQKEYKLLLTQRSCWIPLQVGGGMLIGYFILDWTLSQPAFYIAIIMVLIGIIQLFISEGPVGFFGITGYVGDWLSYARLLALGLATAGMALAFNVVAGLLPDLIPIIGIILLPIVLVFAHLANLILQALGAGVHSLRLQYVEFFNRFYEGGGHNFSPFKITRTYTTIEKRK
jgi:V/A-type H+/Na+-transporting ATPase subunit I